MQEGAENDIDVFCSSWNSAFHHAAQTCLTQDSLPKKRPWISRRTLHYISARNHARSSNNSHEQARMNRLIKHSVKQDRASWFQDMLEEGDWNAVQKFRKFKHCDFNKMRAQDGHILSAHERPEALADHLEKVQWAVRPDTIPSSKPALFAFN